MGTSVKYRAGYWHPQVWARETLQLGASCLDHISGPFMPRNNLPSSWEKINTRRKEISAWTSSVENLYNTGSRCLSLAGAKTQIGRKKRGIGFP